MGIGGRGSRAARFAAFALTAVAGGGLLASVTWSGSYLPLVPSTQAPGPNDNAGPCNDPGATGESSIPLAAYTFQCVSGQWLLTSLDSAGTDRPDGATTTDADGNSFKALDGVWVPQGVPHIPAIQVVRA